MTLAYPARRRILLTLALPAIILFAVVLRILAAMVLQHPLWDDSLSYFKMAQGLVERGEWLDTYGQHAFYSAGYPLLLTPFFALFGSSVETALSVNMLLAVLSTWLVHALALRLSGRNDAALAAAAVFAVWLPGIWNATFVAKENLSTPLLLGLALCALFIARGHRPAINALAAGAIWGAGLITGGSSLMLCAGIGVALVLLWRNSRRLVPVFGAGASFLLGGLLVLGPWLHATDQMVGRPVLTTNAAFNLYLGHNPAATGRFVSIAQTPEGPGWRERRLALGEVALADRLHAKALDWISANPGRTAELAARKLYYFWEPNVPDAADFEKSRTTSLIRVFEVAQYLVIMALGLWGFAARAVPREDKWILGGMLLGFWLVHAAAYIIIRYRDPAVPLLIVMGAIALTSWRNGRARKGGGLHAA